ncbi:transposase [Richelia intracellularis]|nr:transposase [Richelia intracellularis]
MLDIRGVSFALRLQKYLYLQDNFGEEYQIIKEQEFKFEMSNFYMVIRCNKGDGLGLFNIAVYWKRKYRNNGSKQPWYILTN